MKAHLTWIGAAALAAAAFNVHSASAQYTPYRPQQQSLLPTAQATSFPTHGYQVVASPSQGTAAPAAPVATSATAGRYSTTYSPAIAAPYAAASAPWNPQTASHPSAQIPAYSYPQTAYPQTAQAPGYPSVSNFTTYAAQEQAAPLTEGEPTPAPMPSAPEDSVATPNTGAPIDGTAPNAVNTHGYLNFGSQTRNGHSDSDKDSFKNTDYGIAGACEPECSGNIYFCNVSWLYMTRDNPDYRPFTAQAFASGGYPYYPTAADTVLSTPDVDHDYRSGVEIRFGSTFSTGGWADDDCYGYGSTCASCAAPDFAWEVGYWFLDDDVNTDQVADAVPNDSIRMYGLKNFAGLQYDGRPMNDYYDYQIPVEDPLPFVPGENDVRLLAQRIRSSFSAQNLELNLLRLPVCGSTCGTGYGSCAGDDCGGYGAGSCAPACSPFSMTTLCGVRFIRLDDDFNYDTMWAIDDGTGTLTPPAYTPWDGSGELFYDIEVDNKLVGFQLGANMCYSVTSNWNLFWNSAFGLYNNHISSLQRVYGELGAATFAGSGASASVRSHKDDVAFAGEMLAGGTYDFSCHWRGILAYRALAISGVALSVDQMPENFSNRSQIALVDSDGSIIIHGVQVGLECRY